MSPKNVLLLSLVLLLLPGNSVAFAGPDDDAAAGVSNHVGLPMDWSASHLVMGGASTQQALTVGVREPRHVYNMARRMEAVQEQEVQEGRPAISKPKWARRKIDWAVSLENGFVAASQFPAKYRFDIGSQNCTSDFAIFGLTLAAGAGAQANVVGINNLYTEATPKCNGGTPWVAFAYNTVTHTGGQVRTSPVISVDGTKVAFVESTATGSYFHVLVLPSPMPTPPARTGTVLAPATPISCTTPTTVSCMTTVQISAAANTLSSPWLDYANDVAYVGTDDAKVYRISPVFGGGAPAVTNDANWPVTTVPAAGTSKVLTSPVQDPNVGRLFIGDGNGYLYAISTTNPAHATAARLTIGWAGHGSGTGIVDAPMVVMDAANPNGDQVFAVTGCSNVVGIGGAISQVGANFTSATAYTSVDLGSSDGGGNCTTKNVHQPFFDNNFWTNGSTNGRIFACGFVSGTNAAPRAPSNPKMYRFGFDATTHLITATGSQSWVINNSLGDECSPLTEFFDGTTDRLFFGVGGTTDGFIESSNVTTGFPAPTACTAGNPNATCSTAPNASQGTSGIIVDNKVSGGTNIYFSTLGRGSVNGQSCAVAGGAANPFCAVKLTQAGLN
jgi:hypothetical protein